MEQIVAAILGCLSRNFAFEIGNELEGTLHQFYDVLALQIALDEEVVAGKASHWSPIDDAVFPLLVVTQVSGSQVLDGMDGTVVEAWLLVRHLHEDI